MFMSSRMNATDATTDSRATFENDFFSITVAYLDRRKVIDGSSSIMKHIFRSQMRS
jgi:hypothetical protein